MRESESKIFNKIKSSRIWRVTEELIFPRRCPGCDGIIPFGGPKICSECENRFIKIGDRFCAVCGKGVRENSRLCEMCKSRDHAYIRGRILYEYKSAALSIYRFKYGNRREYADYFGLQMAMEFETFLEAVSPDALVPIPLHRKRMVKRGYNQAEDLARALGKYSGIPVETKLLKRIKNTVPMKLLSVSRRENNLKKAFIVNQNGVKLKIIILIDDIYTTGATIDEAARALHDSGVEKIYFLTLAGGAAL